MEAIIWSGSLRYYSWQNSSGVTNHETQNECRSEGRASSLYDKMSIQYTIIDCTSLDTFRVMLWLQAIQLLLNFWQWLIRRTTSELSGAWMVFVSFLRSSAMLMSTFCFYPLVFHTQTQCMAACLNSDGNPASRPLINSRALKMYSYAVYLKAKSGVRALPAFGPELRW